MRSAMLKETRGAEVVSKKEEELYRSILQQVKDASDTGLEDPAKPDLVEEILRVKKLWSAAKGAKK